MRGGIREEAKKMVLGSVADIITALGTATMAGVAFFALRAWRNEFIGKKKIELASEIMIAVMDFQDILISARHNISTPIELNEIKQWIEEVNTKKQNIPNAILWSIYPDRFFFLKPIHQLNKHSEQIDDFEKKLNKALIYFGEDIYKLLVELHSFLGKIRRASEMLYENPTNKEFQQIAFADNANDAISQRIFAIGEEIKLNLEPLYKDQQIKWKKPTKVS